MPVRWFSRQQGSMRLPIAFGGTTDDHPIHRLNSHWRTAMSLGTHASGFWDDVRFGWRGLSKRVGASVAIVLTMALAFAASAVIYSTIDVVQHLIPAPDRSRLVFVDAHDPRRGRNRTGVSVPDFMDWTERNGTFEDLAAFRFGSMNLTGLDTPLRVATVRTTGNFFVQWGVKP